MDQFVEMLRSAQGGHGLENLARVYGLSAQQAQAVAEAVMPAFNEALRHITQSPEAMASLMALMVNGPYGAYYNQPAPPPPQPTYGQQTAQPAYGQQPFAAMPQIEMNQAGTNALNAVFGSTELSRAVANQVAASTGLGLAVVHQAMPSMASLVVGGLAKSLAASGALQQMLAAMLSRMPIGAPETRPAPIPSGNPWVDAFMAFSAGSTNARPYGSGNPWADAFAQAMFQSTAPMPAPAYAPRASGPANAWQDVVNAMANTMAQAAAPSVPPPRHPEPAPEQNPLSPFQDFFTRMFAQGFPPAFPGAETPTRMPYSTFLDFWLDVMTKAKEKEKRQDGNVQDAEVLPPEKPRLVKGPDDRNGQK